MSWQGPTIALRRANPPHSQEGDVLLVGKYAGCPRIGIGSGVCATAPTAELFKRLKTFDSYLITDRKLKTTAYTLTWLNFNIDVKRFGFHIKFDVKLLLDIWQVFLNFLVPSFPRFCMITQFQLLVKLKFHW